MRGPEHIDMEINIKNFSLIKKFIFKLYKQFFNLINNILFFFHIKKKIIISIEGNIGSGKSTMLNLIKEKYSNEYYYCDEPVNEWINIEGSNLLALFYENKERWSYTFQNFAFITRINNLKNGLKSNKNYIITERSILTDKNIFAKMLHDQNYINKMEFYMYNKWFDIFSIKINKIIYIKTDVNNCNLRINIRDRQGENKIEESYLEKLEEYHDNWILNKYNNIEYLILDGNKDFINDNKIKNLYLEKVLKFIKN